MFKKKWITSGIITSCKRKRHLHEIHLRQNTTLEFDEYFKSYKLILRQVIKLAKKMQNDNYIKNAENKTKAIWNIIKQETCKNLNPFKNIQLTHNDVNVSDPLQTANIFNTYFSGIAEELIGNNKKPCNTNSPYNGHVHTNSNSMYIGDVTHDEVIAVIKELKNTFSSGMDNIPDIILKKCSINITIPLTYLCNLSVTSGVFPDILKTAKVIPLHKKDGKESVSNYRPISLPSSISKVLEKLMYKRILSFVDKFNILSNSQHGFRAKKSTDTAIFDFINSALYSIDKKEKLSCICLDLSKAFDVIDHKLLLLKLHQHGIRGLPNYWIKSFLHDRKQVVELKYIDEELHTVSSYHSEVKSVKYGVPQGSVLGPLLFLLYINDITYNVNSYNTTLFADDTSLLIKGENNDKLQLALTETTKQLSSWFNHNNLIINTVKTVSMNFHLTNNNMQPPSIQINNIPITNVHETKFLGLWIQDDLKWNTHIFNLSKKLSKSCYAIRILKNSTSHLTVRNAYFAYFHSLLKYGIIFWGNSPAAITAFKVQKRVVRIIKGTKKLESCKPIFNKLAILPLPCVYILETLLFVKNKLGTASDFQPNENIHNYKTRHTSDLHVFSINTTRYQKGVVYSGTQLYNKLPQSIKMMNNINKFKTELKAYLLEHCFYSVNEYLNCTT